jgi:hypothetical protein
VQLSPYIALRCLWHIFSPRFLTHKCAADNPLASAARVTRTAHGTRTSHALHASLAAIVVPAKSKVVHEEHDRLVLDERLKLDTAQAVEVVREAHMLEWAVVEVWTRRDLDLGVVSLDIVADLGIPSRAGNVEDTWIRAFVVTAEPCALGVEPESRQAVVGAVGDVAGLGTRHDSRHAWLVPSSIIRSFASSGRQEDGKLIARVGCERLLVFRCVNISVAKGKMVVRTEDRRGLRDVSVS